MKAVKVGYVFGIFEERDLEGISLAPSSTFVTVDGELYSLYKGVTFHDSVKVDDLLDKNPSKQKAISDYAVREDHE